MNAEEFYEKLLNLNERQMKLVFDYGLLQIKYMFDVDKILEVGVPFNSQLIGLSVMGRFVAIDYDNEIRYSYFPHNKTWSEATNFGNLKEFDSIEDFKTIYDIFELNCFEFGDLTHVVSKFKDEYTEWYALNKHKEGM